jgi:hypothetical protein
LIAALLSVGSGPALAQELKFNATPPSTSAMLKMRWEGYSKWCEAHSQGDGGLNASQVDECASHYAEARAAANRAALAAAPEAVRRPLQSLSTLLGRWSQQRLGICYDFMGGGTMYSHLNVEETATLADALADALSGWNGSPSHMPAWKAVAFKVSGSATDSLPNNVTPAEYKKSLEEEAQKVDHVRTAVDAMPARPRAIFRVYVNDLCDLTPPHEK